MELIPIEDLERWPVKVIAFLLLPTHGFPTQASNFYFHSIKMLTYHAFGISFVDFK